MTADCEKGLIITKYDKYYKMFNILVLKFLNILEFSREIIYLILIIIQDIKKWSLMLLWFNFFIIIKLKFQLIRYIDEIKHNYRWKQIIITEKMHECVDINNNK